MLSRPTPEEVNSAIRAAFREVSRDDGVSLHESTVIDSFGANDERAAARLLDVRRECLVLRQ